MNIKGIGILNIKVHERESNPQDKTTFPKNRHKQRVLMLNSSFLLPCRSSSPHPILQIHPQLLLEPLPPGSGLLFLSLLPPTSLDTSLFKHSLDSTSQRVQHQLSGTEFSLGWRRKDSWACFRQRQNFPQWVGAGVIGNRRARAVPWCGNLCLSHKLRDKLEKKISLFSSRDE